MSIISLFITCLVSQISSSAPPVNELFVVESENTLIRCGASENYYAFEIAPVGSIIHVVDNKVNWGRVPATGPVFADSWGWIRQPLNEPGRFTILADGVGKTLDTTAVFAPDLDNPNPKKAWRQVCMLPMDTSVEILDRTEGDIDGRSYNFFKVRLPDQAEGWINMSNIRQASPDERDRWTTESVGESDETLASDTNTTIVESISMDHDLDRMDLEPSYLARYIINRNSRVNAIVEQPISEDVVETVVPYEPITHQRSFFNSLEKIYKSIPATDMSEALLNQLLIGYELVAVEDIEVEPEAAIMASIRMRQLEMAFEIREQNQSLSDLDVITRMANNDVSVIRQVLDEPVEYVVLGRLNVSSVFTGLEGRPTLYRVEDPSNGRTLAYIQPGNTADMASMIGQWIGVVGELEFDSQWQVQIVEPERVDLVAATLN